MDTLEKIAAVRAEMKKAQIDILIIPTADPHHSEYLSECYQTRKWLSGFTGSAGTMVLTMEDAVLYTDGRYFIQAEQELQGSGIALMRMRVAGVPELPDYVQSLCHAGTRVGADLSLIDSTQAKMWAEKWASAGAKLVDTGDLIGQVWTDRPAPPSGQVNRMPDEIAGESVAEKLDRIRKEMEKAGARYHLISVLDEIAWTLNVRGTDVKNTPVVISYLLICPEKAIWFVDEKKVPAEVRQALETAGIEIAPYDSLSERLASSNVDSVMLDPAKTTAAIMGMLDGRRIIEQRDPVFFMKAIKNPVEQAGLLDCHTQDGVAVTRFMYWLKTNAGKIQMDEVSVSEKLEAFRREQSGYLSPSFDTICAYQANAAMMHYKAVPGQCAAIKPEGMLLIDSGGQYENGTTDITRTFVMGPVSDIQKKHFTAVLRSVIRLASARFLHGMSGKSLDVLARGPVWDLGLDYRCGTGHGVGFRLNVHEGPNSFRWHSSPDRNEEAEIEPGMVTTDEPGIYLEGQYGIRTENELLCHVREENEYGQFLEFETITFVPIDLDGIVSEDLNADEKHWLNVYHAEVRKRILPMIQDENEKLWLLTATREIS